MRPAACAVMSVRALRRESVEVRDEQLRHSGCRTGRERHAPAVAIEAEPAAHQVVRRRHARDRAGLPDPSGTGGRRSSAAPRSTARPVSTRPPRESRRTCRSASAACRPSAGTTASREIFAKDSSLPIAVEKTICRPSGDHSGFVSRPGCDTIFFTVIVGEPQRVDVGRTAVDQIGVGGGREGNRLAVGRPRERPDAESPCRSSAACRRPAPSSPRRPSTVQRWTC